MWKQTEQVSQYGRVFVLWKCTGCGRLACTGGFAPSSCVCTGKAP